MGPLIRPYFPLNYSWTSACQGRIRKNRSDGRKLKAFIKEHQTLRESMVHLLKGRKPFHDLKVATNYSAAASPPSHFQCFQSKNSESFKSASILLHFCLLKELASFMTNDRQFQHSISIVTFFWKAQSISTYGDLVYLYNSL